MALPLSYTRVGPCLNLTLIFEALFPLPAMMRRQAIVVCRRAVCVRAKSAHWKCSCQWGVQDSNLRRLCHQIYSLTPLTARETPRYRHWKISCVPAVRPSRDCVWSGTPLPLASVPYGS